LDARPGVRSSFDRHRVRGGADRDGHAVVFGRQGEVLVGTPLTLVRSTGEAVGLDAPVLGARLVIDRVDHGPEAMVKVQVEV
jgi:hypothetical protein